MRQETEFFPNRDLKNMILPLFLAVYALKPETKRLVIWLLLSWLLGIVLRLGVIGIAIAMVCDWIIRAVVFFLRQKSGKWKDFQVIRARARESCWAETQ